MKASTLRLHAATLIVLGLVCRTDATAQDAWHKMTGPEKTFTVEMPVSPNYTPVRMKTSSGSTYTMHQYIAEQDKVVYVVQTSIYPPDIDVSKQKVNLQAGLEKAARKMEGGKWATVDWPEHEGLTAVDAVGSRNGNEVRSFTVMKGRQIITLTYAGPPGTGKSPEAEHFVTSLHVNP
jgi:hypothetical protein